MPSDIELAKLVLADYKEWADWKVHEKADERRDMRRDPETTQKEMESVRREFSYECGFRNAIAYVIEHLDDDMYAKFIELGA